METLTLREAVHLVRITHLVCSTPGVGTHGFFFFLPTLYNPLQCSQPTGEELGNGSRLQLPRRGSAVRGPREGPANVPLTHQGAHVLITASQEEKAAPPAPSAEGCSQHGSHCVQCSLA